MYDFILMFFDVLALFILCIVTLCFFMYSNLVEKIMKQNNNLIVMQHLQNELFTAIEAVEQALTKLNEVQADDYKAGKRAELRGRLDIILSNLKGTDTLVEELTINE